MTLQSRWAGFARSRADSQVDELRAELTEDMSLCQDISKCEAGQLVSLVGTVRSVTIKPKDALPAYEIELYDGTGATTVVWLGRRTIPGIVAGRRMRVNGRMTVTDGKKTIYNPRYILKPTKI
jgi:RecG-like helicase